jgi:hypothetical protein
MSDAARPEGYERSDADPRLIGAIAGGLAVFLLCVPFLLSFIYPGAEHRGGIGGNLPAPPQPRLQIDPKADLAALRARKDARLNGSGWSDDDKSAVHIPIARAMDILAKRGLPGWPSAAEHAQ